MSFSGISFWRCFPPPVCKSFQVLNNTVLPTNVYLFNKIILFLKIVFQSYRSHSVACPSICHLLYISSSVCPHSVSWPPDASLLLFWFLYASCDSSKFPVALFPCIHSFCLSWNSFPKCFPHALLTFTVDKMASVFTEASVFSVSLKEKKIYI